MSVESRYGEFSPKAWLKSRRPERFSDSIRREITELERSMLEFHLESVTSRGQYVDFENFARRLCEKEICPNLIPQTGPTGGGDSKVDSETYPVSRSLSLNWHSALEQNAAEERWAFAFSAKKKWRAKLKSDIKALAETKRGYRKAFFVTNQAVSDKKKSTLQDELNEIYKLDIRILDRTWILDRIFTNGREDIAIEELKIASLKKNFIEKGPQDQSREKDLKEIEEAISRATEEGKYLALPQLSLEAADLTRQLELSSIQIEGQYRRAERLAEKYGNSYERFEVAYEWAWTLYYWIEDVTGFAEQYKRVEHILQNSDNVHGYVKLANLWKLLCFTIRHQELTTKQINFDKRTKVLRKHLKLIASDEQRPSNAIEAQTALIFVNLIRALAHSSRTDVIEKTLVELNEVLLRSKGLVGFSLRSLFQIINEIGSIFEGFEIYEEFFENLLETWEKHNGDLSAAKMLLSRGLKLYEQEKYVESISFIGRAIGRLYKQESKDELIQALYVLGLAYENVGLLWASRGTLLNAANLSMNDFWDRKKVTPIQAACCARIKWLELRLGRVSQFLEWNRTDLTIREHLNTKQPESEDEDLRHRVFFDRALGTLMLNANLEQLKELEKLPDTLREQDLHMSSDALLFALGYEERMKEAFEENTKNLDEFIEYWSQLIIGDRTPALNLCKNATCEFESHILGCAIKLKTPNKDHTLDLAESFLAALEATLATVVEQNGHVIEPEFSVTIKDSLGPFEGFLTSDFSEVLGLPSLTVYCQRFNPRLLSREEDSTLKEELSNVVIKAWSRFCYLPDTEKSLDALFNKQRVLDRAISLSSSFKTRSNILGDNPRSRIQDWFIQDTTIYRLKREKPCYSSTEPSDVSGKSEVIISDCPPPEEIFDINQRNHSLAETPTIIRPSLWDRAKWSGVVYVHTGDVPGMALVFKNSAGIDIFKRWRSEIGKIDKEEKIRIVFVKGVDKDHEHSYRVCIGPKMEAIGPDGYYYFITRINQMDPSTPANLDNFLKERQKEDCFFLLPALVDENWDQRSSPKLQWDLRILLHQVHSKEAWSIGTSDLDQAAIRKNDSPVIPKGVKDPPILKLLAKAKTGA